MSSIRERNKELILRAASEEFADKGFAASKTSDIAAKAGIKTLVIPKENERDIPEDLLGLDIHAVETAEEAFQLIFEEE